jgi:beta-aspartyl-peptidase (threonine type)
MLRALVAHEVASLVRHAALPLDEAARRALAGVTALGGTAGLIAVGADGTVTTPFTTDAMACGVWRGSDPATLRGQTP